MIQILVWDCPRSLNVLLRMYRYPWKYAEYRDSWGWRLRAAVTLKELETLKEMGKGGKRVRVAICLQHKRSYDKENLYGSVKPVVDSLVALRWLADDSEKHIDLDVTQTQGQPDKTCIKIELA